MKKPPALSSDLYDQTYYLHTLPGLEHAENPEIIDEAVEETVRFGNIQPGHRVLDFGCGRGTCAIALAKRGCTVLGLDYSAAAVQFASDYAKRFPEETQKCVSFKCLRMEELSFQGEFDVIVFNQVFEHLYDWELELLMKKFKAALKPGGTLVISTPNLNYERRLFPLKRILELPFKWFKMLFRIARGKSRHSRSVRDFLNELFKIRYPVSEHTKLHINVKTPASIRHFMERQGFSVLVTCVDRRKNLFNVLLRRWWGQTIWLSCTPSGS